MIAFLCVAMATVLHSVNIDSERAIEARFTPYQIHAIYSAARKQLCKKSVRIGYTYAKAFKAVRSSIVNGKETILFSSKDQVTAYEFLRNCEEHVETFNRTRSVILREDTQVSVPRFDEDGRDTGLVDSMTLSKMVFDNRSRVLAFSSNPNALRAYGGNVMWDEIAFHPKGRAMWSTIQGRIRWGYWMDGWSSLSAEETMFDALCAEAQRAGSDWEYCEIDIYRAVKEGLVELINKVRGTDISREDFIAQAKSDSILPDLYALEYECRRSNTMAPIVAWERLKACEVPGVEIERAHLGDEDVRRLFGEATGDVRSARTAEVDEWMRATYPGLYERRGTGSRRYRIGYDVAASRRGHLASVWVERAVGERWRHAGLLTMQTEDWDVQRAVMVSLLGGLPGEVVARGDSTGLGKAICWELEKLYKGRFEGVNFSARKSDVGSALMARLSEGGLELSPNHPDVTQDLYCLRKGVRGNQVYFYEARNDLLPASHADIGWSAALAAYAEVTTTADVWVLGQEDGDDGFL